MTVICSTQHSSCTKQSVFDQLRKFPAPGASGKCRISTGDNTDVTGLGPVVHEVDQDNFALSNTTLPGHTLHPGTVERQVVERGGTIFVQTYGDGIGSFGTLNELGAGTLWGAIDDNIRAARGRGEGPGPECSPCEQ